jgi:hypothetical protein
MVKKYIENLKTRSYAEKSNAAFVISLVVTGLITAVWFLTIFANPEGYFEPQNTEAQNLANTGSLFDSFKEGFK